jgi:hypothetical protein
LPGDVKEPGADTAKGIATGAVDPSADGKQLDKGMEGVRSLLQRTGAGLGAAATAVLTGLGVTRLHEIFPIPANEGWWPTKVALIAAIIAAVAGSAALASIFFIAQRRIMMTTDPGDWKDLRGEDKESARTVLDQHAWEEDGRTLQDVELRALRLERISRRLAGSEKTRSEEIKREADRLYALVSIGLHRAAATVLENRSRRAFTTWPTLAALVAASAGIVGLFALADYYKGQRDLSKLVADCVKAENEGALGACDVFQDGSEPSLLTIRKQADAATAAVQAAQEAEDVDLSPEQEALLERAELCSQVVENVPALKKTSETVRAQVVALCAANE